MPAWLVAEYERSRQQAADASRRPKPTSKPYVLSATEGTDAAARRKDRLVAPWRDEVVRAIDKVLPKQKCAKAFTFPRMLCPDWAFVDLHHMLCGLADKLELPVPTEQLVTPITSEKGAAGGNYVTDSFYITNYDLLHLLMTRPGIGALLLKANGTAVMLLPPLKFAFKTTRAPGAQQSLVISGEFGALVWGSRVWHFVNPPGKEMPQETQAREAKEHNHKRGIYCALTKLAGQGHALPLGMLEADFLTAI